VRKPRDDIMTLRALPPRILWIVLACGSACAGERDGSSARVTIDMRCDSSADCPGGFSCTSEDEHGPPTTMCESQVAVACPAGYETLEGFGQTFCKPLAGAGARNPRFTSSGSYRAHGRAPRTVDSRVPWTAR
jgi:hypothetical protein